MGWLQKNRKLEQGTERWKDLRNCLYSFSVDLWGYLIEIDDKDWDLQKIQKRIEAVEINLRLAERIWPEGKPIIMRMRRWFATIINVREEEHTLCVHPVELDFKNPKKFERENAVWTQSMNEVQNKLEQAGKGMLDCCDEIKKWTSIDLRNWLEVMPKDIVFR